MIDDNTDRLRSGRRIEADDDSSAHLDSRRIRTPAASSGRIRRMTRARPSPPFVTTAAAILLLLACQCPLTSSSSGHHTQPHHQPEDTFDSSFDPFRHLDGRQEALMRRRLASWGISESDYTQNLQKQIQQASEMSEEEVLRRMTRETPGMMAMEMEAEEAEAAGRRQDVPVPEPTNPPTVDLNARIVGGRDAPVGAFPQLCALYSGSSFMCGGTLIAKNICLSAAHCSFVCDNARVNIYDKSDRGGKIEEFRITDKIDCPKYGVGKAGNSCDAVIMKLDGDSSVRPMSMNALPAVPGDDQEVVAIGWGATSEGGRTSDKLQMVEVYAMTNDECKTYYGSSRITSDMLCAGVDEGGKDACQGDSGGPLVVMDNDGNPTLIGVVSWGKGCARPDNPGVYMRVSHELTWIRETACKLGATELCGDAPPAPPPVPEPVPPPTPPVIQPSRPGLPGSGGSPSRPQPSSGGAGTTGSVGQYSFPDRPPVTPQQDPPTPPSAPTPASQQQQNFWWTSNNNNGGGDGNPQRPPVVPTTPSSPAVQPTPPTTPSSTQTTNTTPQGMGVTCKDPNSGITMYEPSGQCASGWEEVTHSITSQPEDVVPSKEDEVEDLSDNQLPQPLVPTTGTGTGTGGGTGGGGSNNRPPAAPTLGTESNPIEMGKCRDAYDELSSNPDWTCGDMIFRGGMGNRRDCAWVAEECALRCTEDRFRYCCPATAGLCPDVTDGKCAAVTSTERGIDAGGISDRGIDGRGGDNARGIDAGGRMSGASGVTRGSAASGNKFSVAGTGDRIGDAADRSREDDDGYDPDEDGDDEGDDEEEEGTRRRERGRERRERRRGTRRLLR